MFDIMLTFINIYAFNIHIYNQTLLTIQQYITTEPHALPLGLSSTNLTFSKHS